MKCLVLTWALMGPVYLVMVGFIFLCGQVMVPDNLERWAGPQGTDLGCRTLNAYRERATKERLGYDEPFDGLVATVWSLETRLAIGFRQAGMHTPKTLCDVVYGRAPNKPPQYSWTTDPHRFFARDIYDFGRAMVAAWAVQQRWPVALAVRARICAADHYFNRAVVLPGWAAAMEKQAIVGSHTFLIETGRFAKERAELEKEFAHLGCPKA